MLGPFNPDSSLDLVAHIIQVALTPIFLLSGIATLLNVFSTRFARVADRAEQITKALEEAETDDNGNRIAQLNHLRRRWNWLISASVVALLFAAIHPQGWTLIPALGSIAIVLAALREWRGSIWAPIAAHATNNFIVLSLALAVAR